MEKYYNIATEVAKRTSVTVQDVLQTISHMISALTGFGYSKEQIDDGITIESVENIVRKRISRGSIK